MDRIDSDIEWVAYFLIERLNADPMLTPVEEARVWSFIANLEIMR